ncbi:MAG: SpoIIE family protein phosphatase [Halanaerobiaceae bacterium]|nr:SpoIIE family protein phosphatase [Halanaerobiaceae bacterium]
MPQDELLLDERTLLELLNSLPQEIIYQDLDHRIIWVNKIIIEKYGDPDKITGNYCYKLKFKRKNPCEYCMLEKARDTGEIQFKELTTEDGKSHLVTFLPMKDKEGNVVAISEITADISNIKKEEEKLKEINRQYQYLFENTGDAILIAEADTFKIIQVNQRAVELYKYDDKESMLGLSLKSILRFSLEDFQVNKFRRDDDGSYSFTDKHKCKNGDIIDVEVQAKSIVYNNKNSYLYYIRDIRETIQVEEEKLKAMMKQELDMAYNIQTSFIPAEAPEFPHIDIATYYSHFRVVGGDYFSFFQENNKVGVIIADVMGKGMAAALVVANVHSSFHTVKRFDNTPVKVISILNDLLYNDLKDTALFVTVFYGLFDFEKRIIEYSNAGHNPPIYWSQAKQELILLDQSDIFCGIQASNNYSSYQVNFNKDDIFLFYTDGLVDIRNMKEERFELRRLKEIIRESKHLSAGEIKAKIIEAIDSFSSAGKNDDISFVLCKIKKLKGNGLHKLQKRFSR